MLCTSRSILHGQKASRFVHGRRYGVGLSVDVGLGLLGLYLWWGKPRRVTSRSRPGLVVIPKALAMVCLSVVASPFAILPPPPPGCVRWHRTAPLAGALLLKLPPGWHPTALHLLAPYCYSLAGTLRLILLLPLRSVDPSSVMPSRGMALPPWLLSNTLDRCNDLHYRASGYSGPMVSMFSPVDDYPSSQSGPERALAKPSFLFFWGACGRFWVSLLYVSMNCLLTCLGYIILGARRAAFFLWIRVV